MATQQTKEAASPYLKRKMIVTAGQTNILALGHEQNNNIVNPQNNQLILLDRDESTATGSESVRDEDLTEGAFVPDEGALITLRKKRRQCVGDVEMDSNIDDPTEIQRIETFIIQRTPPDSRNFLVSFFGAIYEALPSATVNPLVLLAKLVGQPQVSHIDFSELNSKYLKGPKQETSGNNSEQIQQHDEARTPPPNPYRTSQPILRRDGSNDNEVEVVGENNDVNNNNKQQNEATHEGNATRSTQQAALNAALRKECNRLDKSRGPRKQDAERLLSEFVEATLYQHEIKAEIKNFGRNLVKLTIQLEGRERAEWKFRFAHTRKEHFIPKSAGGNFELTASDVVMGSKEFGQLRAEVEKINEKYRNEISRISEAKAKLETKHAKDTRIQAFLAGGLTLARGITSRMRFELGKNTTFTLDRDKQATAALQRSLRYALTPLLNFWGLTLEEMTTQCMETAKRVGLEDVDDTRVTEEEMEDDFNVVEETVTHLTEIFNFVTFQLWNKIDESCREREQQVELRSIMQKVKITEATEATVKVLQKNSTGKKDESVRTMVQQETRREVRNINKAKKKSEKKKKAKEIRKNSSAGGESPAPVALPAGKNGKNGKRSVKFTLPNDARQAALPQSLSDQPTPSASQKRRNRRARRKDSREGDDNLVVNTADNHRSGERERNAGHRRGRGSGNGGRDARNNGGRGNCSRTRN